MKHTIQLFIDGRGPLACPAARRGGDLLLPVAEIAGELGYEFKAATDSAPAILCRGDLCIQLPQGSAIEGQLCLPPRTLAGVLGIRAEVDNARGEVWFTGETARAARPEVGQLLPDLTLPLVAGGQVSLSQFRQKRVLLFAWASW